MTDVVLRDTTLCSIVRDEAMNPAGGVRRFLRSVMPHVEEGVVVDTGSCSREGTREILDESAREFSHLRVYDLNGKFEGYAQARNFALSYVKTKRVLVLDADEILTQNGFDALNYFMEGQIVNAISFEFIDVYSDWIDKSDFGHNPRLFNKEGNKYFNSSRMWCGEYLENSKLIEQRYTNVKIFHFRSFYKARAIKERNWYTNTPSCSSVGPSKVEGFNQWKKFNPKRNNYKASELDVPESL